MLRDLLQKLNVLTKDMLSADHAKLRAQVVVLNTNHAKLDADKAKLNADMAELSGDFVEIKAHIIGLDTEIAVLRADDVRLKLVSANHSVCIDALKEANKDLSA